MNRHNARYAWSASVCLFLALSIAAAWAQSQSSSPSDQTSSSTTKRSKKSKKAEASMAATTASSDDSASAPASNPIPATKGSASTPAAASASNGVVASSPTSDPTSEKKSTLKPPAYTASASDIASAKSSGKVWVNLDSGVYHKSGRWYGKTKSGKFMTEEEAKAAGLQSVAEQLTHFQGETMNRKNLLTRILLTVVVLSLMTGLSAAQEGAKTSTKASSTMAASGDLLDINSATKDQLDACPALGGILAEDHRRPSLQSEDGLGKEKNRSSSHLQQDQGHDHRQAEVILPGRGTATRGPASAISQSIESHPEGRLYGSLGQF